MTDDSSLRATLALMQSRGAIGPTSLDDAIAHADEFAAAIDADTATLVDLGSGGGLPGVVIAVRCPHVQVTLVERRAQRADLLQRAVRSLALHDRVRIWADDVRTLAAVEPNSFDVVTARSFADPATTASWASQLARTGGLIVVSEPPVDTERWPSDLLAATGLVDLGRSGRVRRFQRQAVQPH